jgi:hypothetical protein
VRPSTLARYIRSLPSGGPFSDRLSKALRHGQEPKRVWYSTQKEHWLGWLAQYDGEGAYGRKLGQKRTAEFAYNHIRCAPMLLWLAEACHIPLPQVRKALTASVAAGSSGSGQCAALRGVIPWGDIAARLRRRQHTVRTTSERVDA